MSGGICATCGVMKNRGEPCDNQECGEGVFTLTPREIKMAAFLSGACLEGITAAEKAFDFIDHDEHPIEKQHRTLIHLATTIRSKDGPIGDFTEEEAAVIRKAAGRG